MGYCQTRGVQFGAVSNGHQLIAFLATRGGRDSAMDGDTIVFDSLDRMSNHFFEMWKYLSWWISHYRWRHFFVKQKSFLPINLVYNCLFFIPSLKGISIISKKMIWHPIQRNQRQLCHRPLAESRHLCCKEKLSADRPLFETLQTALSSLTIAHGLLNGFLYFVIALDKGSNFRLIYQGQLEARSICSLFLLQQLILCLDQKKYNPYTHHCDDSSGLPIILIPNPGESKRSCQLDESESKLHFCSESVVSQPWFQGNKLLLIVFGYTSRENLQLKGKKFLGVTY